jgi:hypothetical protein
LALLLATFVALGARLQRVAATPELNSRADSSELTIVAANVQLLLIAPDGKQTGYDPKTRKIVKAIPNSAYNEDALLAYDTGAVDPNTTQTIDVKHPPAGKYRLVVSSGTAADGEEYEVQVKLYARDGSDARIARITGTAERGRTANYELQIAAGPQAELILDFTPVKNGTRSP